MMFAKDLGMWSPAAACYRVKGCILQPILIHSEDHIPKSFANIILDLGDHFISFRFTFGFGSDANIYNTSVRGKSYSGVAEGFKISDLFINHAFAESGTMQYFYFDDLVQIKALLQIRHNRFVQNIFHLIGNTW